MGAWAFQYVDSDFEFNFGGQVKDYHSIKSHSQDLKWIRINLGVYENWLLLLSLYFFCPE